MNDLIRKSAGGIITLSLAVLTFTAVRGFTTTVIAGAATGLVLGIILLGVFNQ